MGVAKGRGRVAGSAHVYWRHSRREHGPRSASATEQQTPHITDLHTQTQVSAGSSHHTREENVLNCHRQCQSVLYSFQLNRLLFIWYFYPTGACCHSSTCCSPTLIWEEYGCLRSENKHILTKHLRAFHSNVNRRTILKSNLWNKYM